MPLLDAVLGLILILAVIGLALYVVNRFIPMEPGMKDLMNTAAKIIVAIALLFWLFGLLGYGPVNGLRILR